MTEGTDTKRAGFFDRHPWALPAILALYVALLALGTVGELGDVAWIKAIPIFRGP